MNPELTPVQRVVALKLPCRARWKVLGTTLDFDFSIAHDRTSVAIDSSVADARNFEVFGEYDYAQGGGARPWLAVREPDGGVYGIDLERERGDFVFNFNANLARFAETFELLISFLAKGDPLPHDIASRVADIDPVAYPTSEWRLLIDCLNNPYP